MSQWIHTLELNDAEHDKLWDEDKCPKCDRDMHREVTMDFAQWHCTVCDRIYFVE